MLYNIYHILNIIHHTNDILQNILHNIYINYI